MKKCPDALCTLMSSSISSPNFPYWLIEGTFGFALVLTAVSYARKYFNRKMDFDYCWNETMGKPSWNFTSSWATTLTTVGGLLGIVISTVGNGLSTLSLKIQHVGLFFFFTTIALLAPLVYSAIGKHVITKDDQNKDTPEIQGYVFVFFITCGLILWAVCGQLVTVTITLHDLADESFGNTTLTILFIGALLLAIGFVVSYAIETMPWTAQDQLNKDPKRRKQYLQRKKSLLSSTRQETPPQSAPPAHQPQVEETSENYSAPKGSWTLP